MIHAYVLTTQGTVFNQPDWDNWRCNYNYTTGTSRTCLLWNILILRLDHFEFYPIHSLHQCVSFYVTEYEQNTQKLNQVANLNTKFVAFTDDVALGLHSQKYCA